MRRSGAILLAGSLPATYQRLAAAVPATAAPPVRTITAGITANQTNPVAAIERAAAFLVAARERFEAAGFVVQTTRIVTQPQAGYAASLSGSALRDLYLRMQAAAGPHSLAVGPRAAVAEDPARTIDAAVTAASLGISSTIPISAPDTGPQQAGIAAAAQIIRRIADAEPAANFNFAGAAHVPPGVPFFPAGYHDGGPDRFTLGLEAAGLFLTVCRDVPSLVDVGPALTQRFARALQPVVAAGNELAAASGWPFGGIDPTPAQWGTNSIGAAVEALTGAPFGTPGTLAACRTLTRVVRDASVPQTGFRGLFLPPMEDATLAARAHEYFGMDALLAYSAVCGTGLDTVALPGDATVDELGRILRDVASLATQWNKPLTARLFPVPGKAAGDTTGPVGELFPMRVLGLR